MVSSSSIYPQFALVVERGNGGEDRDEEPYHVRPDVDGADAGRYSWLRALRKQDFGDGSPFLSVSSAAARRGSPFLSSG